MKDLVKKKGLDSEFHIESSATSREEIGNPIYPPIKEVMRRHGVVFNEHFAKQLTAADYDRFDYFIIMDENNLRNIRRIFPCDPDSKIHMLLEFDGRNQDVADPWYYGNFEKTYDDILSGCKGLIKSLT